MRQSRKALVLTHSYPRWEGDIAGISLKMLVEQLCAQQISVWVAVPHFGDAPTSEKADYLEIHRFRYATRGAETLGYTESVCGRLLRPLRFLKFLSFLICFASKAIDLINHEKPNVILAHGLVPSGLVGWFVSVFRGKTLYVVSSGTGSDRLRKSRLLRSLVRIICRRSVRVFMASDYLREVALDLDLATPGKIEVCPLPARTELFGKQPVFERTPPLILTVARLTQREQLGVLIEAMKILRDDGIDFVCEIYGEGECQDELRDLIKSLSLEEQVMLKPPVPQEQLAKVYPSARTTVLPSINEVFGITLIEAQLSGSAVIGARSGGIVEIIRDGDTGLLFEPGDTRELAEQIKRVLADDQLYRRLIKNARDEAERRFSPEVIAARFEQALGLVPRC